MDKDTADKIVKGGWLKDNKKSVAIVLAVIGAVAAYLTGDADLVSTIQHAIISGGVAGVAN